MCDVLNGEIFFDKSASIAFDWSNANGLSPNPYTNRKREQIGFVSEMSSLFLMVKFSLLRK